MKPINQVCHFPFYKNGGLECKIHLEHCNVKKIISSRSLGRLDIISRGR